MNKKKDFSSSVGKIYGYLSVIEDIGTIVVGNKGAKQRFVLAECLNCGSGEKKYNLNSLRQGKSTSCGCIGAHKRREANTTHNMSSTRQYVCWFHMISRCTNSTDTQWSNYGGRGITVCNKWLTFIGFWDDMSETYSKNLELDRIDNNAGYCKENCRWTDRSEQNYNKRMSSSNKTGKTGVSYCRRRCKYRAYITKDGKQMSLGYFKYLEDAVEYRKKAEIEIYGYTRD